MRTTKLTIPVLIAAMAILVSLPGMGAAGRGTTTVKASMDSAFILMGKTTPIHIEIVTDKASGGMLVNNGDTLTEAVEIASRGKADTVDLGNGRMQITQDIIIQSFDSGNYVIPPVQYIVGGETISSNQLALKVIPVDVDSLQDIHDYAEPASIKPHFWDFIPKFISDNWTWLTAVLLLAIAAVCGYFFWWRKRKAGQPIVAKRNMPKPLPPYELAVQQLNKLHSEQLWEHGEEKEFYTRLTAILREYIDSRFHINAMEMTSAQILEALQKNEETRLPEVYMRQILQIADYVKFAKMRPFSEDNVKAFNDAMQFVENTRPRPVAAPESTSPANDMTKPTNASKQ